MKKNYFLIALLALVNIFSATAKTESPCTVAIHIDDASHVKITTMAGHGDELDLSQTTFELSSDDSPLQIEPASESFEIISVKSGDTVLSPSGDGKYRLGITAGLNLTITTKALSNNKTVTFSVTDPAHIVVKDGENVLNISTPVQVAAGTTLTIMAADGYAIEGMMADGRPIGDTEGIYNVRVDNDMLVEIKSKVALPVITFDIDFPERVTVINGNDDSQIDLSSSTVMLEKGTPLTIQASGDKYTIKSVIIDGQEKTPSGDGAYHTGVTGNMSIVIRTASIVPTVKFEVDKPENVIVKIQGQENPLDISVVHELEKGTQLVIEAASDLVRIASVTINNFNLPPAADGKYHTSVSSDLTIVIKTKGILPVLTFHVDAPERIKVLKGTQELDFNNMIELAEGTEITVEPAADNFSITSVKAGETVLSPGTDKKYHIAVTGDMEFEVLTSATLALHITQAEGGTVSVFRGDTQLHEGDKVQTGDELTFKNTFDKGYAFLAYIVNGQECKSPYIVTGSADITVTGKFKTVPADHAIVIFDLDTPLINVVIGTTRIDNPAEPYEVEKGEEVKIYVYTLGLMIRSCTLNDVMVAPDEDDPNSYHIMIEENATIKVTTEQLVSITGDKTTDEGYNDIGEVFIKYKDEVARSFLVAVGETVELVPQPEPGYKLDYYFRNYVDEDRLPENATTYTITEEDRDGLGLVVIKGKFIVDTEHAIKNVNSLECYYDAENMKIKTTGGETQVYNLSGKIVILSSQADIDVSNLAKGVYIVKAQNNVFKLVKK